MSGLQKESRTDPVAGSSSMMEPSMMVQNEGYFSTNQPAAAWTGPSACSQLCRMCATENEYLIPIFEGEGVEHQLGMKIDKHLPIRVHVGDTLPLHVCYQCASTLIAWHDLVVGCIEAEKKLIQIQTHGRAEAQVEEVDVKSADSAMFFPEQMDTSTEPSTSGALNVPTRQTPKKTVPKANPKLKMVIVKTPTAPAAASRVVAPKTEAIPDTAERPDEPQLECALCGQRFVTKAPLRAHLRAAHSDMCVCADCGKTLASRSSLRFHEALVHGRGARALFGAASERRRAAARSKYVCQACQVGFVDGADFVRHRASHHTGDPAIKVEDKDEHKEDQDELKEEDQDELKQEKEAVESEERFECALCENEPFATEDALVQHMTDSHEQNRPFQCDECDGAFFHCAALLLHKRTHHDAAMGVACEYCDAILPDEASLLRHGQDEHAMRVIEGQHFFTCAQCNLSFLEFEVFEAHVEEHADDHGDLDDENVTYKCDVCGAIFLNYKGIVAHVKKAHPGCKIANLPCNKCHASYASRAALRDHRRAAHPPSNGASGRPNAAGNFECVEPDCAKTYGTAHGLSQHVKKFHQRDRSVKFPCPLCDKTFTTVYSRASHMSTHTGELNHQCELCSKAFRLGSSLKEHLLTHTDLMPEECYICAKRFRKKTALRTHLRVHTGERPYPCEICGRRFRQSGDRNKHRNNVHRLTVNMKFD